MEEHQRVQVVTEHAVKQGLVRKAEPDGTSEALAEPEAKASGDERTAEAKLADSSSAALPSVELDADLMKLTSDALAELEASLPEPDTKDSQDGQPQGLPSAGAAKAAEKMGGASQRLARGLALEGTRIFFRRRKGVGLCLRRLRWCFDQRRMLLADAGSDTQQLLQRIRGALRGLCSVLLIACDNTHTKAAVCDAKGLGLLFNLVAKLEPKDEMVWPAVLHGSPHPVCAVANACPRAAGLAFNSRQVRGTRLQGSQRVLQRHAAVAAQHGDSH